jgi:4-hydroxy-tetrahydrodipicolinate synthase
VSVTALAAVCAAHEEIRCVKAEDPPTPRKVAALAERADVAQLGGLGGLHLLAELDAGTDGTMTGFAFPEVLAAIVAAADAGDRDEAGRLYEGALGALTWEAQPEIGLALRKLLLAERGLLPCPRLRHPVPLPADAVQQARDIAALVTRRQQEVRS